jgi:hypothetical protein
MWTPGDGLGGIRFVRKSSIEVAVARADRYGQRDVRFSGALTAAPGMKIIQVHTDTAVLDWVLHPEVVA